MIHHTIEPIYNENSRILILGSFPSVKSREQNFFYLHPQNRFWKVLAAVYGQPFPDSIEQKRQFLLANGIALWDVIGSCEVTGSADNSIKNVQPNDLSEIMNTADIRAIFINGRTAEKYYRKYQQKILGREAVCLPSTSPANASWTMEKLVDAWSIIRK